MNKLMGAEQHSQVKHRPGSRHHQALEQLAYEQQQKNSAMVHGQFSPEKLFSHIQTVVLTADARGLHPLNKTTRDGYLTTARKFCMALHAVGIKVAGLMTIQQKHFLDVAGYWSTMGVVRKASHAELSYLRTVFTWLGKRDVVPQISVRKRVLEDAGVELVPNCGRTYLKNIPAVDLTDAGLQLALRGLAPRVQAACRLVGMFGMEIPAIARWKCVHPDGLSCLPIEKSKRSDRVVEFSEDPDRFANQIEVLRLAKQVCDAQGTPTLCMPGESPDQFVERVRKAWRQQTRKHMGRTLRLDHLAHGLFHSVFLEAAGLTVAQALDLTRSAYRTNEQRIRDAFHEASYQMNGAPSRRVKQRAENVATSHLSALTIEREIRPITPTLRLLGVTRAWVAPLTIYRPHLTFHVAALELTTDAREAIRILLAQETGRVFVVVRAGDLVPEDAVECKLRRTV